MTPKKYDFSNKVILITGSSSGIGAAVARAFAHCNAKVVITGFEEDEVVQMVEEIANITGENPFFKVGSLIEDGFAKALIEETVKHYGKIDVLINNAGRAATGDNFQHPNFMEAYDKIISLNLRSALEMIHLCVPYLAKTKGNIVNTASIAAFSPLFGASAYCCSKAAINQATKCAAVDLGPLGIRVNSVNPGVIRTNIGRSFDKPEAFQTNENPLLRNTIAKELGDPEQVANVVLFLASDDAAYVNGSNYLVDGGFMCGGANTNFLK